MRKSGILTFHKSINYGSVLQAWALQQFFKKRGFEAEIIDYEPSAYSKLYSTLKKPNSISNIKYDLKNLPILGILERQSRLFKTFRHHNMCLSEKSYTVDSDLSCMIEKYNNVICGSDQIWNVRAYDCDATFFLPVPFRGKKIAYAVSVNDTDYTEKRCNEALRTQILDFFAISTREQSGAKKLKRFIGNEKNIETVLDPTLLHDQKTYAEITSKRWIYGDYIFLYNVWSSDDALEAALALSKKVNMPVYTMLMSRDIETIRKIQKKKIHIEMKHTAPQDFLCIIKNAKYVVTDSFHGTAFSIIFEKQFVSVNDRLKQGQLKYDERICCLLSSLGLQCRYITKEMISSFNIEESIDYQAIRKKRQLLLLSSEKWLMDALQKGDYNED